NDIYKKIRAIETPGDSTPLANMIINRLERGDAFPKQFGGFRNLVILTDGEDNISADKKDVSKPGRRVVEALRESDTDVALHIVLFGLEATELKNANEQFKPITDPDNFEKLYRTTGSILPSSDRNKLVEDLRESMLPRVQIVRGLENGER